MYRFTGGLTVYYADCTMPTSSKDSLPRQPSKNYGIRRNGLWGGTAAFRFKIMQQQQRDIRSR